MGSRLTTNLKVSYFRYANVSIGDRNNAVVWYIDKVLEGKFYTFKSNIAWDDSKRNNSIDVNFDQSSIVSILYTSIDGYFDLRHHLDSS